MRNLLRIAALLVLLSVGGVTALSWWFLRPEFLERYVLDSIEERTGVRIDVARLRLGLDGVVLEDVEVFEPRAGDEAVDPPRVLTAKEVAVRPAWRQLLERRIVISDITLEGLNLMIHRGGDGTSNLGRLIEAFASENGGETAAATTEADGEASAGVELDRVEIRDSTVEFTDEHERPTRPLRIAVELNRILVTGLHHPKPPVFALDAAITLGADTHSRIKGSGTVVLFPLVIDTDLELSEVDVDTLVPDLSNPDNDDIPGPLALDGIRIDARLEADRVRYEGFEFTAVRATARLDGTDLTVEELHASIAGGTAAVTANIDFGLKGFHYVATANLRDVDLARADGLLEDVEWGRIPSPNASIDATLSMAGTTGRRLLNTIALDGKIDVDALDLDAILGRNEPGQSRDVGPFDTGNGTMTVKFNVGRVRADPYEFADVHGAATLSDSRLTVPTLATTLADGSLAITADVDLSKPGLLYSGTLALHGAQVGALMTPVAGAGWGTRTGVGGLELKVSGRGTDTRTLVPKIEADGVLVWTNGRVANSDYLKELSDITGIPGFRDLRVIDSGGKFKVRNAVLSSDRMRIWGPDAGIQASGTVDSNYDVDLKVALGIGPNSNRKLFSTGIALPYVNGEHGWRFVPVNVTGNLDDPSMSVPTKAVLQSALTTIPAAGVGAVSTGLEVFRGGTRAVAEGTRSMLAGSGGAVNETASLVDGRTGLVEGLVTHGSDAVGATFSGIGSLFGDDGDGEGDGHDVGAEKRQ